MAVGVPYPCMKRGAGLVRPLCTPLYPSTRVVYISARINCWIPEIPFIRINKDYPGMYPYARTYTASSWFTRAKESIVSVDGLCRIPNLIRPF